MKKLDVVLLSSILLSSCQSQSSNVLPAQPVMRTIQGNIRIDEFNGILKKDIDIEVGKACAPNIAPGSIPQGILRKYGDIVPGKRVLLLNSKQEVVGVFSLNSGRLDFPVPWVFEGKAHNESMTISCVFNFKFSSVPISNFYILKIEGHEDLTFTFTSQEAEKPIELFLKN